MIRRLTTTLLIAALCAAFNSASAKDFYELRTYQLNSPEKAAVFDTVMAAAIPILEEAGVTPVGVFRAKREKDGDPNWRYVLATAASLDTFATARAALASDQDFVETARDYLSYEQADPAFARISVSTFAAFSGFPKLATPPADNGGERFFALRVYESHDELKALLKINMFNTGELDIFADTGLRGVFFGSALSGDNLPNLTYMLVYNNEAEHKKAWKAFRSAPAWNTLKADEKYADTVSKITTRFLVATSYSGIR